MQFQSNCQSIYNWYGSFVRAQWDTVFFCILRDIENFYPDIICADLLGEQQAVEKLQSAHQKERNEYSFVVYA